MSKMYKVKTRHNIVYSGCRSAGPYVLESMVAAPMVFDHFWTTGTTFMAKEEPPLATNVNPTFVYSLVGATFAIHFGTTRIAPSHLAPAFLRSRPASIVASDLVDCAKSQFRDWVTSFQTFLGRRPGMITIRLFSGEALCFCQGLAEYRTTGSVTEDQTVAPWNTTPLEFDRPRWFAQLVDRNCFTSFRITFSIPLHRNPHLSWGRPNQEFQPGTLCRLTHYRHTPRSSSLESPIKIQLTIKPRRNHTSQSVGPGSPPIP